MTKRVYAFGGGRAEGDRGMRELLGGKGANLAEMTNLGAPVPPGFTITTETCIEYYEAGRRWPEGLEEEVRAHLAQVEEIMERGFGDPARPLLLSVRSGARVSMPGMMDTVLNLGLAPNTLEGLGAQARDTRFAWDSYRRLIQMYGNVVLGVEDEEFDALIEAKREERGVRTDPELDVDDLRALAEAFEEQIRERTDEVFPHDAWEQLRRAVDAVFDSWDTPRAVRYRQLHRIPNDWGTAVTVQAMVFGNLGERSATGVAFTRNPATGEKALYGEYLVNAQGEDVVAGTRTPHPIENLEREMPEIHAELAESFRRLETHYEEMQDAEFTVEEGRLYILQTRRGERTAQAAVRIAVEMVDEGLIDERGAVLQLEPEKLHQLLHPAIDPGWEGELLARGLPASPGAATGRVVFRAEDADTRAEAGEDVILVRTQTSADDIGGMAAARGVLTSRGGTTSHAAVVARGMGKPCVVGAEGVRVDRGGARFVVDGRTVEEGEWITLDGARGEVRLGRAELVEPELGGAFTRVLEWADRFRVLGVRANADTPDDARQARQHGAEGIGLCRTEHMFFGEGRVSAMRRMIVADDPESRRAALDHLVPMQRSDFEEIFRIMAGLPVAIRLLDPPLHEFLPDEPEEAAEVARELGVDEDELVARLRELREANPMLGHRGCRLGITHPELYEAQARAIFEAACEVAGGGEEVHPEVMIPLVGTSRELELLAGRIRAVAEAVMDEAEVRMPYAVGTMIEVPRAALVAGELADHADFFSFGTNDLTQMTFGLSRDDTGSFLPEYLEQGILPDDPFQSLDRRGVGRLMELGATEGRAANPKLEVGICGEHGGDPESVAFCHASGFDYVSCSPFRLAVARVAAAQAPLRESA